MAEKAKKTYRLFALPMTEENVAQTEMQRFCRATPRYVLVYTDGNAPDGSVEIGNDDLHRLTQGDKNWLTDCNFIILAQELKQNENAIATDVGKRLEALEEALKSEKAKQKEG